MAPPRPPIWEIGAATLTSTLALTVLAGLGVLFDQVLLVPPLAASMALVAGAPALPLAQPRSVVGGQFVSALTGFAVLTVLGGSMWAAALAGGLALGVMQLVRVPHSPAAASAVLVVLTSPPILSFLALLMAASVVLVAVGIVGARGRGARYPVYW
ncbi:HPP family protein [Sinosporangium siamense]|uniref:Membrane protein n=1 Tax=Sinosporangium siamense TaxID=1367973 RepID=A0A919RJP7_9ACTN|nr:HPP family protein [Sinosporangium siamense]GII94512.1 membrane protein [Sinosporangium siamense]